MSCASLIISLESEVVSHSMLKGTTWLRVFQAAKKLTRPQRHQSNHPVRGFLNHPKIRKTFMEYQYWSLVVSRTKNLYRGGICRNLT